MLLFTWMHFSIFLLSLKILYYIILYYIYIYILIIIILEYFRNIVPLQNHSTHRPRLQYRSMTTTTWQTLFRNPHQPSELHNHGLRQPGETWYTVSVTVKYHKYSNPSTTFVGCLSDISQCCCMSTRNAQKEVQTSVRMEDKAGTQHSFFVRLYKFCYAEQR